MKMYSNEYDYVVADSAEEAAEIAARLYGSKEPFEDCEWDVMDGGKEFTYRNEDGTDVVKTVDEWVMEHGKGYFACSEY